MTKPMLIIVPTRSRPQNVASVVEAWRQTGAFEVADLCFATDYGDPTQDAYAEALNRAAVGVMLGAVRQFHLPSWLPLVPKLNTVAENYARYYDYSVIGFAGDDHLPRTLGWAQAYITTLTGWKTGVVSCPDGYRTDGLPTQWAMTTNIVTALGRMVPAPVEHLYCDNAVRDLAGRIGRYAYLPDLLIEHMHPVAGKASEDEQYARVNARPQYRRDRAAYRDWLAAPSGLAEDVSRIQEMMTRG